MIGRRACRSEIVASQRLSFGPFGGEVEREDPGPVVRLERDLVVDGCASPRDRLLREALCPRATPAASVELVQHRAAPVSLRRRRDRTIEPHAKRHRARHAQVRYVAQHDLVVEACARRLPGLDAPERTRQAREQQEQQDRERHRRPDEPSRAAQQLRRRPARCAPMHPVQGGGGQQCARKQHRQLRQALVAQQDRVEQEIADEHQHRQVTLVARLEELDRGHHREERGAGLDAVHRPEAGEHREHCAAGGQ